MPEIHLWRVNVADYQPPPVPAQSNCMEHLCMPSPTVCPVQLYGALLTISTHSVEASSVDFLLCSRNQRKQQKTVRNELETFQMIRKLYRFKKFFCLKVCQPGGVGGV